MTGQRVTDPERQIDDFRVYEPDAGGWRAVRTPDPELVAENTDWEALVYDCSIKRQAYEIRMTQTGTEAGSGS